MTSDGFFTSLCYTSFIISSHLLFFLPENNILLVRLNELMYYDSYLTVNMVSGGWLGFMALAMSL